MSKVYSESQELHDLADTYHRFAEALTRLVEFCHLYAECLHRLEGIAERKAAAAALE